MNGAELEVCLQALIDEFPFAAWSAGEIEQIRQMMRPLIQERVLEAIKSAQRVPGENRPNLETLLKASRPRLAPQAEAAAGAGGYIEVWMQRLIQELGLSGDKAEDAERLMRSARDGVFKCACLNCSEWVRRGAVAAVRSSLIRNLQTFACVSREAAAEAAAVLQADEETFTAGLRAVKAAARKGKP
jgi:hypothetical protein